MSNAIYDSSLITARKKMKAEAGSYITRINQIASSSAYIRTNGNFDQSLINDIKLGQLPNIRKGDSGATTINNGCPCQPLINNGFNTN